MRSLPHFSVHNPVLVNLFVISLLVGGAYSGATIVREMFPESRPNRILITTEYPGASPAEVEKGITLKIEEQIKDVEGIEKTLSTINEGFSSIMVELESDVDDIDRAVNDVKAAIDTIRPEDFPEEALETRVAKFDPKLPVISVALFGDLDDRMLKQLGERMRDDLLSLPSVTNVVLSGTRKDEISIEVKPERLVQFGLSFMDVAAAITQSNVDLPGGQLRTSNANVTLRTLGEKDRGEDLYDILIRSDVQGRNVHLRDVAVIVDGFEDADVIGRFNGKPAVNLTVYKNTRQDAIAISESVRAMVAGKTNRPLAGSTIERLFSRITRHSTTDEIYQTALRNPLADGVSAEIHTDLSHFIEGRLDLLMRNGLWGLALVTLSLLLFLHWRVALWVMVGLTLAVAGSLICMKLMGQTLNLMTMFGLIVVLGLLVDDGIIVAEHVYTKLEAGGDPKQAAIAGTEEVTWPVVCAIATTIVAFIPLMFIDGQIGDWMGVLPVIVCVALSVSLIEALMVLPSHLAHGLRGRGVVDRGNGGGSSLVRVARRLRAAQVRFVQQKLFVGYERLLRLATAYRYVTVGALLSTLMVAIGAVLGDLVPFVFLPKMDSETLVANVKMSVGAPFDTTIRAANVIEESAQELPELKSVYTIVGMQMGANGTVSAPQSHLAQLFMEIGQADDRARGSDQILHELRNKTSDIWGVEKLKFTSIQGGPEGAPVHLEVRGSRLEDLVAVSAEIRGHLATFSGVFDIVDDFDAGRREIQIELFESARALGLTTQSLATQVRAAFYGFEARKVQRGREDVRIMVRYPYEHRRRISDIERMWIATPSGNLVPMTEVARLTEGTGHASINRTDQQRTVTVTADVDSKVTTPDNIIAALASRFPSYQERFPGTEFTFGGQKLETRKSFASLKTDFFAALLMIYAILAGLFKSYTQPLIVMAVIPFGLIGAVAGHFVMGYPLTILSLIGLVALTGIVVNDSMILVSFINRRLEDGASPMEAVIEGGKSRLRPILLTSITTVLGLAPLMLETSFQAKFLIPMGLSISAGLIFATVLTLVAVPSLYLILLDVRSLLRIGGQPRQVQPTTAAS